MTTGKLNFLQRGNDLDVEWEILDLDTLSMMSDFNDICHVSPTFFFQGEKWCLNVWPNGTENRGTVGHIDVALCRSASGPPIYGRFSFALKTVNGSKDLERQRIEIFEELCLHRFDRFLSKVEYERKKSELLVNGLLTVVCTLEPLSADVAFRRQSRKYELTSRKILMENDDIKEKLHAFRSHYEVLSKEKLELETDLKTTRENLVTVTEEKEQLFRDLTDSKETLSFLNNEINNLLRSNEDLTREKDESVLKYKKLLEESYMKNNQLMQQLFAVSQELEAEKNKREHLEPANLIMRNTILDLQSTSEERAIEVSTAETSINKAFKSEIAESHESKISGPVEKDAIEIIEPVLPDFYGIMANVNRLLEEGTGIDATFVLQTSDGDIEVFAHQLILAVRSSFFADAFYSKERNEAHKIIPLKDVDPKDFQKMIKYCYDCEPGLKTTEEACALFKVAFEFRVISLMNLCGMFLKSTKIEIANIFSVLQVSKQLEDKSLTDNCLKVLEEKTVEIMSSYELRDVTLFMVRIILKLPKLSLNSEYELILWILDWAKFKSEDRDLNCKSARDFLGNLLRDMNFLSLTGEEFAKICKDHPDFFNSEEMASLSLNIMIPGSRKMPDWYNKDLKLRVYTGSK